MKNTCILSPATLLIDISQFHFKHSGLNKPGGAGSFLHGRCQSGVAAPHRALLLDFIYDIKLRRYNEEFYQTPRAGNPGSSRKANHPSAIQTGSRRHYARYAAPDERVPATSAHPERQACGIARQAVKADYPPIFSTYFLNLQRVTL